MRILLAHDGSPSARQAVAQVAEDAAQRLRGPGRTTDAEVRTGDTAGEIIASADRWDADLVLMGSRGYTGLPRVLLGSVARNVVHGGGASVLIVHAPAGN